MKVPLTFPDHRRWLEKIAIALNLAYDGKTDNVGTVTLTASATTTTVTDKRTSNASGVYLCPTTANAATALSTTYLSARTPGTSFTLTHANTADVDKTFTYTIVG